MTRKTVFPKNSKKFSNAFIEKIHYISGKEKSATLPIFHNLDTPTDNFQDIEQEFLDNYKNYHSKGNNRVVLFHEILSFAPKNSQILKENPHIIQDLSEKWFELRAEISLGYAKAHFDQDHVHVHFLISGNLIGSSKSLRLSKKEFSEAQRELERYQREKYPELEQTRFYEKNFEKKGIKKKRGEQEQKRHTPSTPNKKEQIKEIIEQCFSGSLSQKEFLAQLKSHGLEFYQRGKKSLGVIDLQNPMKNGKPRKYKFETLGLMEKYREQVRGWEVFQKRERELREVERRRGEKLLEREVDTF